MGYNEPDAMPGEDLEEQRLKYEEERQQNIYFPNILNVTLNAKLEELNEDEIKDFRDDLVDYIYEYFHDKYIDSVFVEVKVKR